MRYAVEFTIQGRAALKVDADDVNLEFAGSEEKEFAVAYNFTDANKKTVAYVPFGNVLYICPGQEIGMPDIKIQLEVCESDMDNLNDWEQEFIESISDQFTRTGELSPKQKARLQQIYDKVV